MYEFEVAKIVITPRCLFLPISVVQSYEMLPCILALFVSVLTRQLISATNCADLCRAMQMKIMMEDLRRNPSGN